MTLTVTLELSPAQEKQLRVGIANHDQEIVRQLLLDAIEPTVADLLAHPTENRKQHEQRRTIAKQLRTMVAAARPVQQQGLSDYAVSREGIYADHP